MPLNTLYPCSISHLPFPVNPLTCLQVGGNTLFPGFADRLQQGLAAITPYLMKNPSVVTPPDAKLSAWHGGSMLASLSTFRDMCIHAKEYEEYGPVMMHRKCWGLGL